MSGFTCQKCQHRPATTHITLIVLGIPGEVHLCEACKQTESFVVDVTPKCPSCGLSYAQIQQGGRFGCSKDYEIFAKYIVDGIESYHGASRHVGKIPKEKVFSS